MIKKFLLGVFVLGPFICGYSREKLPCFGLRSPTLIDSSKSKTSWTEFDRLSVSFSCGYKDSYSSFSVFALGCDFQNGRIKVEIGPSIQTVYGKSGVTLCSKWNLVKFKEISFTLNADYQYLFSGDMSIGYGNSDNLLVKFHNPETNHIFAGISIKFHLKTKRRINARDYIALSPCFGFSLSNYKTTYVSGDYSSEIENKINTRLNSGLGVSISYVTYLYTKK